MFLRGCQLADALLAFWLSAGWSNAVYVWSNSRDSEGANIQRQARSTLPQCESSRWHSARLVNWCCLSQFRDILIARVDSILRRCVVHVDVLKLWNRWNHCCALFHRWLQLSACRKACIPSQATRRIIKCPWLCKCFYSLRSTFMFCEWAQCESHCILVLLTVSNCIVYCACGVLLLSG